MLGICHCWQVFVDLMPLSSFLIIVQQVLPTYFCYKRIDGFCRWNKKGVARLVQASSNNQRHSRWSCFSAWAFSDVHCPQGHKTKQHPAGPWNECQDYWFWSGINVGSKIDCRGSCCGHIVRACLIQKSSYIINHIIFCFQVFSMRIGIIILCIISGYADPEYITTGKISEKADIYGFGIVLFEIISGRPIHSYMKAEGTRELPYPAYVSICLAAVSCSHGPCIFACM